MSSNTKELFIAFGLMTLFSIAVASCSVKHKNYDQSAYDRVASPPYPCECK